MLKKIRIETTLVTAGENGDDVIRTCAEGTCVVGESGLTLRYPEPENNGLVELLLADSLADLKRNGDTCSRMTFIDARMLPCIYQTPHGPLPMSIYTHEQSFAVNAAGGRFQTRYALMIDGRHTADNTLTVEWNFL